MPAPSCGYAFAVLSSLVLFAILLLCPIYVFGAKILLGRAEVKKDPGN